MAYATLMVHVDADGELPPRVKIAAELAERFQASLIGVAAWAPISVFLAEDARSESSPQEVHLQDMKSLLDRRGHEFRAQVGLEPRRVEWRSVLDLPTDALVREARAADLVIIGNTRENPDPFRMLDPGSVLMKAGRPVLAVPRTVGSLAARHVAIAWKDVREARRAVRDALPFLKRAESVMIVEVSGETDEHVPTGGKDVAAYLARHAVKVVTERVRVAEVTVTNTLLRLIEDENIDLLVAGAYGHSRFGEWVFGGITRDLLKDLRICCLFSH
jgi:nucleotide-binding universal stress UspA family protein